MKKSLVYFSIPLIFYFLNLFVQNYNLGKTVLTFTDEGVYLYSAKLISQGLTPYKEFFLAHPPYGLLPISLFFRVFGNRMDLLHFLYTVWVFSSIFPLYILITNLRRNYLAATLALLLFSTFSEMVQWDARFFALRQFSMPLLAFALLFLKQKKQILAGFTLGLFSLFIVSNLFIAIALLIAIFLAKKKEKMIWNNRVFLITFFSICLVGYTILFFIPNSVNNLVAYQVLRPFLPIGNRFVFVVRDFLPFNWPLMLSGLLGSILLFKKTPILSTFNGLTFLIVTLMGSSFYPHYLVSLATGLTLSAGMFFCNLAINLKRKILLLLIICASVYFAAFNHLLQALNTPTPHFYKTVDQLKQTPDSLFTLEPIYALYANKNLTYHYNVADMRYFRVLEKNLSESEYISILKSSQTVLLEPFAYQLIPKSTFGYIYRNFHLFYFDGVNSIYVKK